MNIDYQQIEYIQKVIGDLLSAAGFNTRVEYEQSLAKGLVFNIRARDARQLIGREGQVLLAVEQLVFAMVNRHFKDLEQPLRFSIDVDEYRRNREFQLKQLVKDSAAQLRLGKDSVTLPPMPRNERRFVHSYIQEQFPHFTTESVGNEPNREIKIRV